MSARITARLTGALAAGVAALMLSACAGAASGTPGGSGSPTPSVSQAAPASLIEVGDCVNDGSMSGAVTRVPIVDCSGPHDAEAYASFTMAGDVYPGQAAIEKYGDEQCADAFATFVGVPFSKSSLNYTYYYPGDDSWQQGDRLILCEIYDQSGPVTGTLKGAER